MKKAKWGRVINIASAHGLVASPFKSAYVAAKHGVVGFTKSLALEVAEQGITANSICPGFVMTPLVEKQIDDQARVHGIPREDVMRDVILAPQPTKQFVKIEDVAAMALYLASEAAAQVNGAALSIDGGWTAR
jgi:3-hydroxybutyrate dehydrogenase